MGKDADSSVVVTRRRLNTSHDVADMLLRQLEDLDIGARQASVVNATCNGMSKLAKFVELEEKYGKPVAGGAKVLALSSAAKGTALASGDANTTPQIEEGRKGRKKAA